MNEAKISTRIRYDLSDEDIKFFQPNKRAKGKITSNNIVTKNQNGSKKPTYSSRLIISNRFAAITLLLTIIFSGLAGFLIGVYSVKNKYETINHWQESIIRSEAIADYKAHVEAEEAELSAIKMESLQDEASIRKAEINLFAKLFEGVRDWGFDATDLITYGVCAWNRMLSPLFANSLEEVIHQPDQWINFSDDNKVVADYYKIAEKLVDILHNSDVALCSSKYCWIEIRDGHVYLKDSYEAYPGMTWWRYNG